MSEPTIHQEGPETPEEIVEASPNANKVMNLASDEEKMLEYDMLQQQVEDGKYDGDGPADVAEVSQTA